MLINAYEYAELKKIPISKLYYQLRMGKIKNAFKIGDVWKVLI